MEDKKGYCEKLYNRYKKLVEKDKVKAVELRPNRKIQAKYAALKNIKEASAIRKQLRKCLHLLTDEQLRGLFNDDSLMGYAVDILAKRHRKR